MTLTPRALPSIALALGCAIVSPSLAVAEEGDACVLSYENAQVAKKKGDMVGAKEEITLCEHACPTALSKDCEAWLPEVQAGIGKVALTVTRRDGAKPTEVRVFVDGVETALGDGNLEANLGKHTVRVESAAMRSESVTISLVAGVPLSISVVLDPRPAENDGAAAKPAAPIYPFVVGGVGLGVVALGAALGIVGQVDVADMRATCAKTQPLCSRARVQVVREEWIAGGVLAGIGGAAVAAAAVMFAVDRPRDTARRASLSPLLEVDAHGVTAGVSLSL